ncbi:DUF748 domain-containing protein [Lutimonas sp.]|uniref:DUF748 domain-containing protein n=1 Tax=Lutimonas sp. TaxID=1872403 RepID=UPI003D9B4035
MKKVILRIVIVLGILFVILKGIEWWLEHNFAAKINANPERAYNIDYEDFDLHTGLKGITLDKVKIRPLNETEGAASIVGDVEYATLKGLVWVDLLFGKTLNITEISFEQPVFEITLRADTVKKNSGTGIQDMFGDILSRGDLQNFRIENGSMILKEPGSGKIKGEIKKVNVLATDLETDTVQLSHLIPFKLGDLQVEIEEIKFDLNEYTHFKLGKIEYDLKEKVIKLLDLSMGYSIDWVAVSNKVGFQNDIIELHVKEISMHELEPSSSFYSHLDISARKVLIDSLDIKLSRNKNLERPADVVKPMFNGMISAIPIPVELDSIQLLNSTVTYQELGAKKEESGKLSLRNIDGVIRGFTNIPEKQDNLKQLRSDLSANFNGYGNMQIALVVPYKTESFQLKVDMKSLEMNKFNPMLIPLAGVKIESGELQKLEFKMNAGHQYSKNNLIFDYKDLHVSLIKEKENHKFKKRAIISMIAEATVKNNNYPEYKNYLTAAYDTERNVHRSPVNYIIQGMVQGIVRIVPGKNIGNAVTKDTKEKKDKKKKKKKEK